MTPHPEDHLPLPAVAFKRAGYKYNSEGAPNLYGIRGRSPFIDLAGIPPEFESQSNKWDDRIGVFWFDGRYWHDRMFEATTDPGDNHAEYAPGQRGVSVMKPGQYVDAYTFGEHRGYPAIVNWGLSAPAYWRVVKLGSVPAVTSEGNEYIGLNIHRARLHGETPDNVGPFSKGCQVLRNIEDWNTYLPLVTRLADLANCEYLTYTLLLEEHVFPTITPQQGQLTWQRDPDGDYFEEEP